jgi:hypothetical protein
MISAARINSTPAPIVMSAMLHDRPLLAHVAAENAAFCFVQRFFSILNFPLAESSTKQQVFFTRSTGGSKSTWDDSVASGDDDVGSTQRSMSPLAAMHSRKRSSSQRQTTSVSSFASTSALRSGDKSSNR